MKEIRLLALNLKNFKGVRSFSLKLNGHDGKVFGDNATGKTTLFDAFVWLLFDKDSNNRKDFAIKTLDKSGQTLHNLDHEVEGVFLVGGKKLALKKVYREKWTKRRGSVKEEFTGHTTDYFVDGVPVKKKDYDETVNNLIQEDVFKLLTSPTYFNEQLKWQDRRKVLLEVAGDVTDEEVIRSNKELADLLDVLNGRKIEDHKKVIAAKKKEINDQLEKIPVRIDEINHNLPDLTGLDKEQLEADIAKINAEIDAKQDLISNIRNGTEITEKKKRISEVEIELMQIKQQHEAGTKDELYRLKAKIQEEESNISILESKIRNLDTEIKFNTEDINRIESQLQEWREEWQRVNQQQFEHDENCNCPTCGQPLPEEQIQEARENALKQFNLEKAKKLEEITAKGKKGAAQKQKLIEENEKLEVEKEKIIKEIEKKQSVVDELNEKLKLVESTIVDITENPQYVAKLQEKQQLQNEITELQLKADESIQAIHMEILELKQKRDQLNADLGKFAVLKQSEQRIKELEEQERELAAEYEQLEHQLYLTEEFIRTKVDLLEDKINSKFKYARFKLFETQINGGIQEVCETLYEGVPYSSLNSAARINIGLDIIDTLSEHFGFRAPIFVDNAESVTKLIDIDSQIISLVVSEKDKKLRVEVDSEEVVFEEAI